MIRPHSAINQQNPIFGTDTPDGELVTGALMYFRGLKTFLIVNEFIICS